VVGWVVISKGARVKGNGEMTGTGLRSNGVLKKTDSNLEGGFRLVSRSKIFSVGHRGDLKGQGSTPY